MCKNTGKSSHVKARRQTKDVMRKNSWFCARCGKDLLGWKCRPTVDHVIPKSKGGLNNLNNYIPLCEECNMNKSDKIIYPSFYYVNMDSENIDIVESDRKVKEYLEDHYTNEMLLENHLLFDDFLFSVKFRKEHISLSFGWNDKCKSHYYCNRMDNKVYEFSLDSNLDSYEFPNDKPIYVLYKNRRCIVSVWSTSIVEDSVVIDIHYTTDSRLVFYCLKTFIVRFKSIYVNVGIRTFIVHSKQLIADLQLCDYKSYMEVNLSNDDCVFILEKIVYKES